MRVFDVVVVACSRVSARMMYSDASKVLFIPTVAAAAALHRIADSLPVEEETLFSIV